MVAESDALSTVIERIHEALERFPLLDQNEYNVAFSGGKDSITLAYALASMNRRVQLLAVDMGYSVSWHERIRRLADSLDFDVSVVDVWSLVKNEGIEQRARDDLAIRRAALASGGAREPKQTPCTNCYNSKLLALVHGAADNKDIVCFGHHGEDVLASLIKSVIMYYDRWNLGNRAFDETRFREIGWDLARDFRAGGGKYLSVIEEYVEKGFAHTSEPPVEQSKIYGRNYTIARPMIFVSESMTSDFVARLGVRAESSGCGHSMAAHTRTPREIVHYDMFPFIQETKVGQACLKCVFDIAIDNVDEEGRGNSDPRKNRDLLLGKQYKGGPEELADRL
jgi:tRNA(Ile)-lysidine synthase TilS/MesJ